MVQKSIFGGAVATCNICGRPLSDPRSVEAGIGPICAGKGHSGPIDGDNGRPTVSPPYHLITVQYPYDRRVISVGVYMSAAGTWGKSVTVILAEPLNYEGMSVTNAAEYIATAVVRTTGIDPARVTWVEHYSAKIEWREDESFALINFEWSDGVARSPDWRHIDRVAVEALLGREVPEV